MGQALSLRGTLSPAFVFSRWLRSAKHRNRERQRVGGRLRGRSTHRRSGLKRLAAARSLTIEYNSAPQVRVYAAAAAHFLTRLSVSASGRSVAFFSFFQSSVT